VSIGLPVSLTRFIGRREELLAVRGLLDRQRLVTLTGIGGCGKTRLAVEACTALVDRGDEVCWVDLGAVTNPAMVARLVATSVNVLVDAGGDAVQALVRALRSRQLLLCLDTCEHVLDAVAGLTRELLENCPQMSVLATSRQALGVPGEAIWTVPPMDEQDAYRLFADRAALVAPWFSAAEHAEQVRAACRRVDGIPLAIELAAAWARALSPAQILAGLEKSFRMLEGGPRGVAARHQTLTASLDWSHELLDDAERRLFCRLSVFAGSFTLDAAGAVCSAPDASGQPEAGAQATLSVLRRLLDKSLVVLSPGRSEMRYRLLDTIRQYADEKLRAAGELESTRDRHLAYFLALAERAEPELERDQDTWREVLDGERDNIAAALRWGLTAPGRAEQGRRLSAAMARQWMLRGQAREGLDFLRRAAELAPEERSSLQARLWCGLAMLAMVAGQRGRCAEWAARGLQVASEVQDAQTRARCLTMLAFTEFFVDMDRCQELAAEGSELGTQVGDPFARDWGTVTAAYSLTTRDRHGEAVALARAAYEASWPRHDRWTAGFARGVEVYASMHRGDVTKALSLAEEEAAIVAPLRDYFAVGTNVVNAALAFAIGGDIERARRIAAPVVWDVEQTPDADVVGFTPVFGLLDLWAGDLTGAMRWFQRGIEPERTAGDVWTATRCFPGLVSALRRLDRRAEAAEYAQRGLTLARGFGAPYVIAGLLDEMGYLAAETDLVRAAALHHEALEVRHAAGLQTFLADSLDALAYLACADRRAAAARLFAASDAARARMGYPRPPVDRPRYEEAMATLRAALGNDEFTAASTAGAELSIMDAVAMARRGRGTRQRPPTGWASLTSTELEVVRLVAGGLTNPQIAQRMFVTRATVKTHLSHIYAKLNITNRASLASLASANRDGLSAPSTSRPSG
jgi:predicted ATPase/DNA-binding CsgD family transcriptional regulator